MNELQNYSAADLAALLKKLPPDTLNQLYKDVVDSKPKVSFTDFVCHTSPHKPDPWQIDLCTRVGEACAKGGARIMIHKPPQHGGCIVEGELVSNSLGFLTPIEDIQVGSSVLGVDGSWRLKQNEVVGWIDSGEKDVVKVTLQSGRVIRMTPCHKVLTLRGWVSVGDLKYDDAIAAPRSIGHCMTQNLPDGYASLLGYLVGDGNVTNGALVVTSVDQDVIQHVQDCADAAEWIAVHEPHKMRLRIVKKTRKFGARIESPFRILSKYLDICTAPYKRVPSAIMNGSRQDLASFIGAYFNCDGYVGRSTSQSEYAEFYSTSEHLLRDVQLALKRFGINATLRKKPYIKIPKKGANHDMWRLVLGGHDLVEFAKEIPVVGVKGEKLRLFAHLAGDKPHSHEYDAIPEGWKSMLEKSVTWHRYNSNIRADKRYKKGIARRVLVKLAQADYYNKALLELVNEDIIWERIKSIEPDGRAQTYDIQTESDHNFTVNGVFVHNSHLIAQRFPAWLLGLDPTHRVKICCYNIQKAEDHGQVVTNIVRDEIYRELFPDTAIPKVTPRNMWSTYQRRSLRDGQPSFHCIGLESGFTGLGVDTLIIDDPYASYADALSDSFNRSIEMFWRGTAKPRLNEKTNVVVMYHRYTEWDFVSWLRNEADWTELRYAAICDDPADDPIGRQKGELLSPRFTKEWYEDQEKTSPTQFAALFQGKPVPEGGGMLKPHFFNVIKPDAVPPLETFTNRREDNHLKIKILAVDLAVSEQPGADYTVAMPVGMDTRGNIYFWEPFRERCDWPRGRSMILTTALRHSITRLIVEEVAQGKGLIANLREEAKGCVIVGAKPDTRKAVRFSEWMPLLEQGKLFLVNETPHEEPKWIQDLFLEARAAPNGKHDDILDCISLGTTALRGVYFADNEDPRTKGRSAYRFKRR